MPYEYEIPAINGKPLVEIPKELKDKVIDYIVLRDKIIIKASDLVDQLLYDTRVKVRDELGRLVKSITEYSYPSTASAIVCKDEDYVYAWKPANNFKGYILIDKGEAGVEDAEVIQAGINEARAGKLFIAKGSYDLKGTELQIPAGITIEGEGFQGSSATHIYTSETQTNLIKKAQDVARIIIRDIYFDGNNKATNVLNLSNEPGAISGTSFQIRLQNVHCRNANGGYAVDLTGCEDSQMLGCLIAGKVRWEIPGGAGWITDTYISEELEANAQMLKISGSTIHGIKQIGNHALQYLKIDGCYLYQSSTDGIVIHAKDHRIVSCTLDECYIICNAENGKFFSGEISRHITVQGSILWHGDYNVMLADITSQFSSSNVYAILRLEDTFRYGSGTITPYPDVVDFILTGKNFSLGAGSITATNKYLYSGEVTGFAVDSTGVKTKTVTLPAKLPGGFTPQFQLTLRNATATDWDGFVYYDNIAKDANGNVVSFDINVVVTTASATSGATVDVVWQMIEP